MALFDRIFMRTNEQTIRSLHQLFQYFDAKQSMHITYKANLHGQLMKVDAVSVDFKNIDHSMQILAHCNYVQKFWDKLSEDEAKFLNQSIAEIQDGIITVPGDIPCDEILSATSANLAIREAADGSFCLQAIMDPLSFKLDIIDEDTFDIKRAKIPDISSKISSLHTMEFPDKRYPDGKLYFYDTYNKALSEARALEQFMHPKTAPGIQFIGADRPECEYHTSANHSQQLNTSVCDIRYTLYFNVNEQPFKMKYIEAADTGKCEISFQKLNSAEELPINVQKNMCNVPEVNISFLESDRFKQICYKCEEASRIFDQQQAKEHIELTYTGSAFPTKVLIDDIPMGFSLDVDYASQLIQKQIDFLHEKADKIRFFDPAQADEFTHESANHEMLLFHLYQGDLSRAKIYQIIQDVNPKIAEQLVTHSKQAKMQREEHEH